MCGIAGFYTVDGTMDRREMQGVGSAMNRAMAHRGPDANDVWQDPDLPLVLAQGRLAIIDLSEKGLQPMPSHTGRYMIVYNGEIYNFRELMTDLLAKGHVFKGHSDTEVLLTAIEHWGLNETLQKINGMFAFALWDREEKKLHLVRDRFGKKPLYIGWAGGSLVFASELKAFHAHPHFKPELDRNVLAQFMRFGYVCAPYAIFKNVWQLLPAGRITFDLTSLRGGENILPMMETYWSLRRVVEDGKSHMMGSDEDEILSAFEDRLTTAVTRRMVSDVPLGAFLSGGIDSSTVVALMQQNASRAVKTFSIGFEDPAYDESGSAAAIANHLGTDHCEFRVGDGDMLDVVPMLAAMYDEPFADSSQIPTYLISKLARQHVTVALTGDGGDEILGGYQRHTHIPALWGKIGWIPSAVRQSAGRLMLRVPQNTYDRLKPDYPQFGRRVHRAAQVIAEGDSHALYTTLLQVWPEKEQVVPGARAPIAPLDDPSQWPAGLSLADKLIYADTLSYRPNDLMVKTDRASMAVALEARAPLMDYELCEFSWRLPHDMKIRGLEGKWLLRRVLERHVPKSLFNRPKSGFNVPLHQWLKGPLKTWGDDLLSLDRLKKQNILSPDLVAGRWEAFQEGRGGHANAGDLWTALMFQSWYDRWMR